MGRIGRKQSNALYPAIGPNISCFKQVFSSDLKRAYDTGDISSGFEGEKYIKKDQRLRELNFGKLEGAHFDSLSSQNKNLQALFLPSSSNRVSLGYFGSSINDISFKAPNGESWEETKARCLGLLDTLDFGNYLMFSHAGLICTLTWDLGIQDVIPTASAIGLSYDKSKRKIDEKLFLWTFPKDLIKAV